LHEQKDYITGVRKQQKPCLI